MLGNTEVDNVVGVENDTTKADVTLGNRSGLVVPVDAGFAEDDGVERGETEFGGATMKVSS